jgi:DNA-directed RNA polymerase omega subunit
MLKNAEDIISLPIEIRPKMADSKFRLVHIASQRVRELSAGEPPLVASKSIKDTTISLEESLLGVYKVTIGPEAMVAKEELRKRKEQERLEEQLSAKEEEIRKELSAYLTDTQDEQSEGELGDAESAEDETEPSDDDVEESESTEE